MKPMLASPVDFDKLAYPTLVSPKIDGIRCIVSGGVGMSRSWKPLPNRRLQALIAQHSHVLEALDGEIVVGAANAPNVYNSTMSGVMSEFGAANFTFLVFDWVARPDVRYSLRHEYLLEMQSKFPGWVRLLPQDSCWGREEVDELEQKYVGEGYEGVIARSPFAPYKQGRSTVNQGYLLKLKRFQDAEAGVVATEELLHNDNPAFTNELGHTAHTSHKAGQRPGGVLGALVCITADGVTFKIGTGFDASTRAALWKIRGSLIGKTVKYKFLPHGTLEAPRHPVFLGFRDPIDT